MNQVSPKTARRVRRRIENDSYAKEAHAWSKVKTIWSRPEVIYRPISTETFKIEKNDLVEKKNKPKRKVNVYLFRIKTKGHDEEFLKIGITNNVEKRFEPDLVKYKLYLLGIVGGLTRKEALDIECRLHDMFAPFSYRPRFGFVTGGYTECYVDCADVIDTTLKLFGLIEDERGEHSRVAVPKKFSDPFADKYVAHHEQIMKAEKEKSANWSDRASVLIEASVVARRERQRKRSNGAKKHKTPSVELLKNQRL
jgi:hypothetical protein